MASKSAQLQKRRLEVANDKENLDVNNIPTEAGRGKKAVGAVKLRDSWETPWIVDLGNFRFLVKLGDNVTLHDTTTLSQLFPEYAAAATKFARELEMEAEGFITCAVHSLVWRSPNEKRHHVYTQISGQAGYVEHTTYPRYLKDAIRNTWHSPGEEFSDPECDEDVEVIELSDSDLDYDTE